MRQLCLLLPKIKLQVPCIHWPEKQKPSSKSNKYYTKHMENEKLFGHVSRKPLILFLSFKK